MRHIAAVMLLLAAAATPRLAEAQVRGPMVQSGAAVQENRFQLSSAERRHSFELPVNRTGRVRVQVMWTGSARRMELSLFAPGEKVSRARSAGSSPLSVEFTVDEAQLRAGNGWIVAVTNLEEPAPISGWAIAEYPTSPQPAPRAAVAARPPGERLQRIEQATSRPQALGVSAEPASDPGLRITPDGSVERTLPDGSVRRSFIDRCGWETVFPDGTSTRAVCVEVVRTTLTALPPGLLNDENLNDWLDELSPNLLEAVAAIVQDENEVQNYLTFEGDRPLPARVDTRLRLLNLLLIGRSGGAQ